MYSSNCDLRNYYIRQAGSGLRIFKVPKGQVGYNIFSNFFRKYGVDLLKFIGRKTFEPLKEVGREIFVNKGNAKEAIKRGLKKSAKNIAVGLLDKAKDKVEQFGTGRRRRRRTVRKRRSKRTTRKRASGVRKSKRRVTRGRRKLRTSTFPRTSRFTRKTVGDVFGY